MSDVTTYKKFSRNGFQISKHKFNRVLKLAENSGFSIQLFEENSTDVKTKSKVFYYKINEHKAYGHIFWSLS